MTRLSDSPAKVVKVRQIPRSVTILDVAEGPEAYLASAHFPLALYTHIAARRC